MQKTALTLGAAVTAVALAVAGCSNSTGSRSATASSPTGSPSSSTSAAVAADHNQADATFAQQMILHHQQAVQMSDMLLAKQGIDPRVVNLANQIKAAQGPEIQTMQGSLTKWGVPAAPPPTARMPGMMSDQDMAALQNAQGVQASKTFLNQMIQHHHGAITMAQTELTSGQNSDAIALAKSISTSQQQEITTMQNILSSV